MVPPTGDDDIARLGIDRGNVAFEPKVDAGIPRKKLSGRSGNQSSGALPAKIIL